MTKKEIFKDIPGYEGLYQVSNLGNVKSIARIKANGHQPKDKILKFGHDGKFYLNVKLYKDGNKKTIKVHQLVAMSFLNHKPDGFKLVVNHIDFNRQNNKVENLEIITQRENSNKKHLKSASKFTGLYWHNKNKKWVSRIKINGKTHNLGSFECEIKASEAYQKALKEIITNG